MIKAILIALALAACGGDDSSDMGPDAGLRDPRPCTDFSNDADYRELATGVGECHVSLTGTSYVLFHDPFGGPDAPLFIAGNRSDGSQGPNSAVAEGTDAYLVKPPVQWQGMTGKAVVVSDDYKTCRWVSRR